MLHVLIGKSEGKRRSNGICLLSTFLDGCRLEGVIPRHMWGSLETGDLEAAVLRRSTDLPNVTFSPSFLCLARTSPPPETLSGILGQQDCR